MRTILLVVLSILLNPYVSRAQKDIFIVRTNFANQGEQEDYWAEKFFYENYRTEIHQKYRRQIREYNKITFGFDSSVVLLLNDRNNLSSLFKTGILFPELFSSYQDTIKIDALEELPFIKLPPTQKRFRLWFYGKGQANPNVYLFELSNKDATSQTSMEDFMQNAVLTFIKRGWRIL